MSQPYLSTAKVLGLSEQTTGAKVVGGLVEQPIGIARFNRIMAEFGPPWPEPEAIIDQLFERLDINWQLEDEARLTELDDKPKVFVANHPYGLPDALAMFRMLTQYRPRLKLFANTLLSATQLNDDRLLFVDPFMSPKNRGLNRQSVASALKHLREGGDLALFPGRICSHLKTKDWIISDADWTDQVHKFVNISGGHMVPMHISGRNSMVFNLSGLIHPRLRTYMLLREFLRGGHNFQFRIGDPLTAAQLAQVAKTVPAGDFARNLTYALKAERRIKASPDWSPQESKALPIDGSPSVPVIKPLSKKAAGSLKKLVTSQRHLITQNSFSIFCTEGDVNPELMDAICDVRFAAYASETTATHPSDLKDRFDSHYSHLILWDNDKDRIAGTYRFYLPQQANKSELRSNLVTNSIFELSDSFLNLMPNAMELGRAAITPQYQKSYVPLILLWRGIMEIPAADKNIKYLFGPVTMGQNYTPVSRELLRQYLEANCMEETMEGFIRPKRPLDLKVPKEVSVDKMIKACSNFGDLGNLIAGFEAGKRTLPVLFRHYTSVGCRYLGVGEWKELNNSVTGLTMLALRDVRPNLLARYFGEEGAREFIAGR